MEKKKSIGITVFGRLIVILGILNLFYYIYPATSYTKGNGQIIDLLFSIALLICGVFILKLRNMARKLFILLAILDFIWLILTFSQDLPNYPFFVLAIPCIYFFTRPKVKEQFK